MSRRITFMEVFVRAWIYTATNGKGFQCQRDCLDLKKMDSDQLMILCRLRFWGEKRWGSDRVVEAMHEYGLRVRQNN